MTANGAQVLPHSTRLDVIDSQAGRILCVADVRGKLSLLNQLAAEHNAKAIIHTGDFGFYEAASLPKITDRTLRHLVQYSNNLSDDRKEQLMASNVQPAQMRSMLTQQSPQKEANGAPSTSSSSTGDFALSEFPKLLTGQLKFTVPVYAVWGACEDIAVLERLRIANPPPVSVPSGPTPEPSTSSPSASSASSSEPNYSIPNLTILSESCSRVLNIGGIRLRLFGLGGACVPHKMFDNGEGQATIAGGAGTMWTSMLQIGELIDTAQRVYDPTETRVLVTHAAPGKEGLMAQLALALKADFTISASLHFRYGTSYNDFSVVPDQDSYRNKFAMAKNAFQDVWDTVKGQVESVIDDGQRRYLNNALAVTSRVPFEPSAPGGKVQDEPAWRNSWNWNLPDVSFGSLVLDCREGRVSSEMKSQGFNFAYRAQMPRDPPAQKQSDRHASGVKGGLPGASANSNKQQQREASPKPQSPAAQPPKASQNAASAAAPQQSQPPTGPKQAPTHRKEPSNKDSAPSSGPPVAAAAATSLETSPVQKPSHLKNKESKQSGDRPASRSSGGGSSRRGSGQHFKRNSQAPSSRNGTPPPAGTPSAESSAAEPLQQQQQQSAPTKAAGDGAQHSNHSSADHGNRGSGRGGRGFFRGRGGRGRGDGFRGGRGGGRHENRESGGEPSQQQKGASPAPAAPSPAPAGDKS